MGADVIKVESFNGDDTRAWGPPFATPVEPNARPESAYFLGLNRNKRSICVNFKQKKGLNIIKDLAAQSDVFIENYVPGKLKEFGLGYEDIKKVNPGIVYASITGYGPDGPYSSKPGYDVIIEGKRGGKGEKIDVSLLETQVSCLANIAQSYLIGGTEAKRWGTEHPSIVPYQVGLDDMHLFPSDLLVLQN
ncbi:hypothetical protein HDU67_000005 [Dinochytrium kinnereticum]|nr:hypothetical protein HDU67_000005 [Dinochytrium kinnereticum]